MSIKRLLPLAVLFAIGACGVGPNALCTEDPNANGTAVTACTYDPGTPAASVQR